VTDETNGAVVLALLEVCLFGKCYYKGVRLTKNRKLGSFRIKFNLDKLKDPNILKSFQASIGGKFEPLLALEEDIEMEYIIDTFNDSFNEAGKELLGRKRIIKKP